MNFLFVSGSEFETPIPEVTTRGRQTIPAHRLPDARRAVGVLLRRHRHHPGDGMRVPGIGSQYLFAMRDADKNYFDGGKTYKVTLPKGIPEANFWSFTLYDNQTRSMLDTPQRYPRAGSQSYPSPAAEPDADGATDHLLQSDAARGSQARQLDPDHARQRLVHDPAPLQPARTVLHQRMAAKRGRTGPLTRAWKNSRWLVSRFDRSPRGRRRTGICAKRTARIRR